MNTVQQRPGVGYLVDVNDAETAAAHAAGLALRLETAAQALHAEVDAVATVTASATFSPPIWRRVVDWDELRGLPVPPAISPRMRRRLEGIRWRLSNVIADLDAAAAAWRRLEADIDEDLAAAHNAAHAEVAQREEREEVP